MAEEGEGFPWHFDTNNFTITLAIQSADEGGLFEYAPNMRAESENFAAVRVVLDGDSDLVRSLALEPGDLQIFKGRHSLHRVTPLWGQRRVMWRFFPMSSSLTWLARQSEQSSFMAGCYQLIWSVPGFVLTALSNDHLS